MDSLIISSKALRVAIFAAFSWNLRIGQWRVDHIVGEKGYFIWKLYKPTGNTYPHDVEYLMDELKNPVSYHISKDELQLTSLNPELITRCLSEHFERFKLWPAITEQKENAHEESYQTNWHPLESVPTSPVKSDDHTDDQYTDDVLIDIDGNRKFFHVGWFDHSELKWMFKDEVTPTIDLEHGKWCYLPMVKYDK